MADFGKISSAEMRLLVESCRRNNMDAKDTHKFITTAWGNNSITLRSVYRLMEEFSSGKRNSFEDAERSGRPKSATTEGNAKIILNLILEFPHSTIDELQDASELSHGAVQRIVKEELRMEKKLSRWMPHFLNDDQKESRVTEAQNILNFLNKRNAKKKLIIIDEKWFFHRTVGTKQSNAVWISKTASASEIPTVCRMLQHEKKTMLLLAVTFTGSFCVQLLPQGIAINSELYLAFLKHVHHNFSRHVTPLD